ncbi:MAG: GNAT family N-acetyltransferase [Candidatus Latescibacteria bacterium]|nr:GNAT family N-acetyltransferase [Candidatus Latescibacterota bacterium]
MEIPLPTLATGQEPKTTCIRVWVIALIAYSCPSHNPAIPFEFKTPSAENGQPIQIPLTDEVEVRIRPLAENELTSFSRIGGATAAQAKAFAQMIQEMWVGGNSEPAMCFVAEDLGGMVARMVYRKPGSGKQPSKTRIIHGAGWGLSWSEAYKTVGAQLLQGSLAHLKAVGVSQITGKVISGMPEAEKVRQILQQAGLSLEQEKRAFAWDEPQPAVEVPDRLVFSPLPQVGEEAFIGAIENALEGSLDRVDQIRGASETYREMAEDHFATDRDYFGFDPAWWQLALDRQGRTVGFVQPAYFKDSNKGNLKEGTVVYIGVAPEHRGQGYSVDLLLAATKILQGQGIWRILCDTDAQNTPMVSAFQRAGYKDHETVWIYTAAL